MDSRPPLPPFDADTAAQHRHIDGLDLACYLPLLRGIPTVCAHQNVESARLRRRAKADPSRVRGA